MHYLPDYRLRERPLVFEIPENLWNVIENKDYRPGCNRNVVNVHLTQRSMWTMIIFFTRIATTYFIVKTSLISHSRHFKVFSNLFFKSLVSS